MRANATQKAYDEAFLACSTAVYFEGLSNEKEALRSWKTALDAIYYHNARRNPITYRPASETERALLESLRQLELQCKERVDLLEALKESRKVAGSSTGIASNEPAISATSHPRPGPAQDSNVEAPPGWLGIGTIPPIDYADLSRPAPLPYRPVMPSRKSSGHDSRLAVAYTGTQASTGLNTWSANDAESRTPSPEKKGRMLRTLRPGRDVKPTSSRLPNSLRSRPDASKAATQAWTSGTFSSSNRPSLEHTRPSSSSLNTAARPCSEGGCGDRPIHQPTLQERSDLRLGISRTLGEEQNAGTSTNLPSHGGGGSREILCSKAEHRGTSIAQKAPSSTQDRQIHTNPSLPSNRKDHPRPMANLRPVFSPGTMQSYTDDDRDKRYGNLHDIKASRPIHCRKAGNRNTRVLSDENMTREHTDHTLPDDELDPPPPPPRMNRKRGESMRANLPPTLTSDESGSADEGLGSDQWKKQVKDILSNLPRGVDQQAAQQILNEIVIQGDEVHWDDVAGLDIAKSALKETVVYPFLRPDLFMGLREPARGMLLFGPPGTGKTMLARAVATESRSTFFAISASSLTSKFLGESEKLVRALFQLAKMLAPSIIFVDEIDSLLSSRSSSSEHEATRRIKTEFLIQWSDLQKAAAGRDMSEKEKDRGDATRVLVLAATNLPWAIDEAARRRFVRRQYIPLPENWVRKQQVKTLLSHQKHELSERDLDKLIMLTEGFSGSDITALAKDAAMGPLRSLGEKLLSMTMDQIRPIRFEDFQASLQTIRPSVSKQGLMEFEKWAKEFGERGG